MGKSAQSTSIIGGSDGPTSIFIAGKGNGDKNIFRRIKYSFMNWRHKRKSDQAKKQIQPGTHTLDETISYIKEQYQGYEADASYPYYEERKRNIRRSVITHERPELVEVVKRIDPPKDFGNQEELARWERELREQTEEMDRKLDAITEEAFRTDYHLYIVEQKEVGTLEIEFDSLHPQLCVSYSGDMKKIAQDIQLYYGVSEEDINTRSDRYITLLAVMSI